MRRLPGPVIAIISLAVVHGALSEILGRLTLFIYPYTEMAKASAALGVQKTLSPTLFSTKDLLLFLNKVSALPLGLFSAPSDNIMVDILTSPWYLDLLNSLLAAVLLFCLLVVVNAIWQHHLPRPANAPDTYLQRFLLGQIFTKSRSAELPYELIPTYGIAERLKKLESLRYGPILAIAVFHLLLGGIARMYQSAALLEGAALPTGPKLLVGISRLPLTPVFIPNDFWRPMATSEQLTALITLANSLLFGVLAYLIFRAVTVLIGRR